MDFNYKHLNLDQYNLTKQTVFFIFIFPILLTLIVGFLMVTSSTRAFSFWLLDENSPIEILTFVFFLIGSFFGIWFSVKNSKILGKLFMAFYLFFSVCLFFIAMEEIAWGQWFFHFETPEKWNKINMQGETTLHNLKGLQGNSEILRILFGLGGLIGVLLNKYPRFKMISVPKILTLWFLIIVFHGIIDFYADIVKIDSSLDFALQESSELIELFISVSAFLYLYLNYRLFRNKSTN